MKILLNSTKHSLLLKIKFLIILSMLIFLIMLSYFLFYVFNNDLSKYNEYLLVYL